MPRTRPRPIAIGISSSRPRILALRTASESVGLAPARIAVKLALPTGKAAESIVRSAKRLNIWHGSVSSGKTISSILAWLNFIATGPDGEFLMVGKTERTLKRNVLDVIE